MIRILPLALVACNQVLDIEKTDVVDLDHDSDGLVDEIDNCPSVANPYQEDLDDDGLGDVCDPCPPGSNHDEDGDGILDGCDNCPHDANPDQTESDDDELGDSCDPRGTHERRIFFDGFAALDYDWIPGKVTWAVENDAAIPVETSEVADKGMWNRRAEVATGAANWWIEVAIEAVQQRVGVYAVTSNYTTAHTCIVEYTPANDTWAVGLSGITALMAPPPQVLRLRLRRTDDLYYCEAVGIASVQRAVTSTTFSAPFVVPALHSPLERAAFRYVEIVMTE
jgi:hypothetical protein